MKRLICTVVGALLSITSLASAQDVRPAVTASEAQPAQTEAQVSADDQATGSAAPTEAAPIPASPPVPPTSAALPTAPAAQSATNAQTGRVPEGAYRRAEPRRYVLLRPVATPIRPREPRRHGDAGAPFSFGLGVGLLWPSDRGYRVAGVDDTQRHFDVFASYDVFQPHKRFIVAAGASFRTLLGADSVDNGGAELTVRAVQADLTGRYQLLSWLWPHVRASLGATFSKLTVEDVVNRGDRSDLVYEGKDQSLTGMLGAGFTVRTKARAFETYRGRLASLSFGVMFEGGYVLAPRADLKMKPNSDATRNIATGSADLGSLDLSAPYVRITAITRF